MIRFDFDMKNVLASEVKCRKGGPSRLATNGSRLKEVGGIYGNAFAEKILSFTTNLSRGTLPPISFRCCYGMGY
jgi:hypothetical protein